jgi:hypothetical protein
MLLSHPTALPYQPHGSKIIVSHMQGKAHFKNNKKNLFIWILTVKFSRASLLLCFNVFFNSNKRLDNMNEKFVEFLSDHKFFLYTA